MEIAFCPGLLGFVVISSPRRVLRTLIFHYSIFFSSFRLTVWNNILYELMPMKNISISLPDEVLDVIDRERAPRHCSRSQYIRDALAVLAADQLSSDRPRRVRA